MNKKLDFALVIHCHQPVGNFDTVMEEAYEKAYFPFLKVLGSHPSIKVTLHYSGCLLDWLIAHKSDFLKNLKKLSAAGQIEFLSGGYYEPVLSLIPDQDKIAQIKMLSTFIKKNFGQEPQGLWLTERVWEPSFVKVLAEAGIKYTIVDDTHFKKALGREDEVYNYYLSDFEGRTLFIFPGSEKLRYMLPFKLPQDTVQYLRQAQEKGAISVCFADDGEKFGLWPKTYKWVYEEKWLDNFFTALEENSSWLNVTTLSQIVKNNKPVGLVYLPCASYREMLEWSGGYFNNFLVKYPEANWMQKRMLQLSRQINGLNSKNRPSQEAKRHLYMAQCNCAYWHGVFGGLYLGHLRHSVFSNLIEAGKLKENIKRQNVLKQEILDLDKDGGEEIILGNKWLDIFISPSRGGAMSELDYKPKSLNLTNVLSRRRETYHQRLLKSAVAVNSAAVSSPQSIHNLTLSKEEHLENYLVYDDYTRSSLLEHFLDEGISAEDFSRGNYIERGDFIKRVFAYKIKTSQKEIALNLSSPGLVGGKKILLTKQIKIFKDKSEAQINYYLENQGDETLKAYFAGEFNFYLYNARFSSPGRLENLTNWDFMDEWYKVRLHYAFSQKADLLYYPIETISDSESGLKRSYQGLCLAFFWGMELKYNQKIELKITLDIKA